MKIEEVYCSSCCTYYELNELDYAYDFKRINGKDSKEKYLICPECEDNSYLNFIIQTELVNK